MALGALRAGDAGGNQTLAGQLPAGSERVEKKTRACRDLAALPLRRPGLGARETHPETLRLGSGVRGGAGRDAVPTALRKSTDLMAHYNLPHSC